MYVDTENLKKLTDDMYVDTENLKKLTDITSYVNDKNSGK